MKREPVKTLEILFEVTESERNNILPVLKYLNSNQDLKRREVTRASLRPDHLVLDNNQIYVKEKDIVYLDSKERNVLKVIYFLSPCLFKE